MTLEERLSRPGPKRILALDGGGIRGALTLGFLVRIEGILRERTGRDDLVLSDYFDLIGGTSTGAIIAAALAMGMPAQELLERYLELGGKVFGRRKWIPWKSTYDEEPLVEELARLFGDVTLGEVTRTGLCVVAKRADTGSTWPLINHPGGAYFADNKDIRLADAVRASAAAPTFFVPVAISVGTLQRAAFIDGAVSMAGNPALQLFLIACLKGFPFRWEKGEDRLSITSVGTGSWRRGGGSVDDVLDTKAWNWATELPSMFMADASRHGQLLLQFLSRSPTRREIDGEVGDLRDDLLTPEPALWYVRYDVQLEAEELAELGFPDADPAGMRALANADNRFTLADIGARAAQTRVRPDHFPDRFDP